MSGTNANRMHGTTIVAVRRGGEVAIGGDGQVSFGDFLALLGLTGACGSGTGNPDCTGDIADDFGSLGADGQVSFGDFLALLGLVGPCE